MPRYITVDEAAEMLGLSARTIRRRIRDRSLRKADLIGRAVRIPLSELHRLAYGEVPACSTDRGTNAGDRFGAAIATQEYLDESGG